RLSPKPGSTRRCRPDARAPPTGGVRGLGTLDIAWLRFVGFGSATPLPGRREGPGPAPRAHGSAGLGRGEDLVELAAVAEVPLLRLRPGTEGAVDGHQLYLGEAGHVLRRGVLGMARA